MRELSLSQTGCDGRHSILSAEAVGGMCGRAGKTIFFFTAVQVYQKISLPTVQLIVSCNLSVGIRVQSPGIITHKSTVVLLVLYR